MPRRTDPLDQPPTGRPGLTRDEMMAALADLRQRLLAAVVSATGLDRHDAEDITHDAIYSVIDSTVVLDDPAKLFAYLKTAAINRVRDDLKKSVREDRRIGPDVDWLTARVLPDPAELVGREMLLLDALDDLATLPDLERDIYWLRHYEQLMPAQIADRLGMDVRQVETRLRQAKKRLDRLHAQRKDTEAYVLFAALLRPVRRMTDAASVAVPPVLHTVAVAVVTAFALVVTQGAATGQVPRPPARAATEQRATSLPPGDGPRHGPGPASARPVVGAGRGASSDPARASHPVAHPACVRVYDATSCVEVAHDLPATDTPVVIDEDVLTITVLGTSRSIYQTVVPLCDVLPTSPAAECTGQGSSDRPVKSPPTPAAGGPSSWQSPYVTSSPPSPSSRCPR